MLTIAQNRMWSAMRRLPYDCELLAEVLVEILEIIVEEENA